jgi:P-type Cu+ transporter
MNSTVLDPVCGMTIDPASAAATSRVGETTIYFCASACKTTFDAAPEKFMELAGEASCCASTPSAHACCSH